MARYLCQLCNTIVAYGEKHPCFFYKDDDNVYSLPQLDELDEMKHHDEAEDKFAVSSNDISWRFCPSVHEDGNEESKQMNCLLTENNEKASILPSVRGKRSSSPKQAGKGQFEYHLCPTEISSRNFEQRKDPMEILEDLTDRPITSEVTCQAPGGNVRSSNSVKENLDPSIDANTLPGPSGIRPRSPQQAGKGRFACDWCPREFPFKSWLEEHYRTHTGEKPYVCDKCKKGFARKRYFNLHYRIHTREIFICDVCGQSFRHKGFLRRHYKRHTPE